MNKIYLFFLGLTFLSACTPPHVTRQSFDDELNAPASSAPPHVTIQSDEFSKDIAIVGTTSKVDAALELDGVSKHWFLRSWVNKENHTTTNQLYVELSYKNNEYSIGNWKFFISAADQEAHPLKVTSISKDVVFCGGLLGGSCLLSETIGVGIATGTLEKYAKTGYRIKINAKSGNSIILPITPSIIQMQLDAIHQYAGTKQSSSLTRKVKQPKKSQDD